MKVKDLMTKEVITASKYDSIIKAANLMTEHDIGMLVIVDNKNEVLGVLTDRDIVIRAVSKNNNSSIIDDVMTPKYLGISLYEDIKKAIEMMGEHQLKRLVVMDDAKKCVGVLSLSDLARSKYIYESLNETIHKIAKPNPQKEKPLKYLEVDDFRL